MSPCRGPRGRDDIRPCVAFCGSPLMINCYEKELREDRHGQEEKVRKEVVERDNGKIERSRKKRKGYKGTKERSKEAER